LTRIFSAKLVLAAALLPAAGCGGALPPPDPPNLAEAKDSLSRGNYWYGRGCYQEAERFFQEGESSARLSDDVRLIIRAQNSRGAAALARGEMDRAANYLEQALELAQAQPGRPELDRILGNLGTLAQRLGQNQTAENLWREAALAASESGSSPAPYRINLARLCLADGRREEFLTLAERALAEVRAAPAAKSGPELLTLADALNLAGQAALQKEEWVPAEEFFREALALDRQMEYTPGLAQDTEALGELLLRCDRPEEAAGFLDRAFYLRLALGDTAGAGRLLAGLEDLSRNRGFPKNLEAHRAALARPDPYRLDQRCP
jgi:tetratricopeptide (TPR) repeat protein